MAKNDVPPGVSAQLDRRLMAAKPADLSERQWCLQSKVSTSFFTDLRNGREPGIDKVERLANTIGLSLSGLVDGVERRVEAELPSVEQLEAMVQIAVDQGVNMSTRPADLARIVAPVLREQLELFRSGLQGPDPAASSIARGKGARPRQPTKPT